MTRTPVGSRTPGRPDGIMPHGYVPDEPSGNGTEPEPPTHPAEDYRSGEPSNSDPPDLAALLDDVARFSDGSW